MLILSRKIGQSIIIDNKTTLTVVEIRGDRVRLGFEAPKDIPIRRDNAVNVEPKVPK